MSGDPILILQLQRMGDLILTFPLLLDLARRFPQNPLWLAGEPLFFRPLMQFAPTATFFPPGALPSLAKHSCKAVINLSSRPEAAIFTAKSQAEIRLGQAGEPSNSHIHGFWHLYRAALTANNRHNRFHWSDLFRLDLANPPPLQQWRSQKQEKSRRVGLFTGASEAGKRPDAEFWISLARRLAAAGYTPILLGGPAEKDFGAKIAAKCQIPNFCGKTTLAQLAALISSLDLFVTPDTGPMHLADWLGAPALNLSLGNVSPWETGPMSQGQWIAQAGISCAGCWKCMHARQWCRQAFSPQAIANLCLHILENQPLLGLSGLRVLKSSRASQGLYHLESLNSQEPSSASALLGAFWQESFLQFSRGDALESMTSVAPLATAYPRLCANMGAYLGKLLLELSLCRKRGEYLPEDFWTRHPWHSSLFAGHCQMWLQNGNYSAAAWSQVLRRLISLREIFAAHN